MTEKWYKLNKEKTYVNNILVMNLYTFFNIMLFMKKYKIYEEKNIIDAIINSIYSI